jgi:hypothetical protein
MTPNPSDDSSEFLGASDHELAVWDDEGGAPHPRYGEDVESNGTQGRSPLSELNLTVQNDPLNEDRLAMENFSRHNAVLEYRPILDRCYDTWHDINNRHFDSSLMVPHISIGRTAPRRFSQCRRTTNYGGQIDITISEAIAFATNRNVVRRPFPSEGTARFLNCLILGEAVKQFVVETHHTMEDGYGGYGPLYAAEATRIGATMGLPRVRARRRGYRDSNLPVAAFWPWAYRDSDYYLGDIDLSSRQIAGLRVYPRSSRSISTSFEEYYLYLLIRDQVGRLRSILERHVDAERMERAPASASAERGPIDLDGRPLPMPEIDTNWLLWNDGCVARMAEHIARRRQFDLMPILSDAMEEAGCSDYGILIHLRQPVLHTAGCWVLKAIRETGVVA